MKTESRLFLWKGLGSAALVFCTPVGIYAYIQSIRMNRSYKIGDMENVESCIKKIQISWWIIGAIYALIIIIAILSE